MIQRVNMLVSRLEDDAILPSYAHFDDAGMDIYASHDQMIYSGETKIVGTGVAIAVPEGYVGLVHPRSSLGVIGVTVMNSPGTIDSGYRGELKVILHNAGKYDYEVKRHHRIAQLVLQRYTKAELVEVNALPDTLRGEMGFGSTGI